MSKQPQPTQDTGQPGCGNTLPDCMMPDGAEPCRGYQALLADRDRWWADNKRLGQALINTNAAVNELHEVIRERDEARTALAAAKLPHSSDRPETATTPSNFDFADKLVAASAQADRPPAAVADYTERARAFYRAMFYKTDWGGWGELDDLRVRQFTEFACAVASERDAEIAALKHDIGRAQAAASSEADGWDTLLDAIAHGTEENRAWLRDAIAAHRDGKPVPAPRGQGTKDERIARLEGTLRRGRAALFVAIKAATPGLDFDPDQHGAIKEIDAALAPTPNTAGPQE